MQEDWIDSSDYQVSYFFVFQLTWVGYLYKIAKQLLVI